MARLWSGTCATSVVAAVAARPAVAVALATGALDACSAELLAKVGEGNLQLGEVLKGNKELCVGDSVVGS